jgi:hypothetical protein
MSNDPIRDLEDFNQQGLNVNPLPPAEVRRLGDRMRRRNAAFAAVGAAAATAVIVTPLAFLTNVDDHAEPPVTNPSVSQTPTSGTTTNVPVNRIPADFPLAEGWGDVGNLSPDYEFAPPSIDNQAQIPDGLLEACNLSPEGGDPVDRLTTKLSSPVTMYSREIQLFADDQEAAAYAASIRSVFERCRAAPNSGVSIEVIDSDRGDESFAVTQGGESAGLAVAINLIRVGNAVLVDYAVEEGNHAGALSTVATRKLTGPLDALDTLVHGTSGEPPPTDPPADPLDAHWLPQAPESELVGQGDVPDLPLRDGLPDMTGDGGELLGPDADIEGVDRRLVCGDQILDPGNLPTGRLVASSSGPEYLEVRQVVAYADADAAVRQMTYLRQLFDACPTEDAVPDDVGGNTMVWDVFEPKPGYDTVAVGQALDQGLGGQVFQFTRVGRAILALSTSGELSRPGLRSAVEPLDQTSRELAPLLCSFTEAGC